MIPADRMSSITRALPFWMSLLIVPIVMVEAAYGSWTLILAPLYGWGIVSVLDAFAGLETENADPNTPDDRLFWYRLIILLWFPIQFLLIFGTMAYVVPATHLAIWEKIGVFYGVGVASGSIGINYAHELMHQKNRLERWLGDLLMTSVLYGHFRSEHLLVHHRYVGTPRDPVTARYNENFHRFFARVLVQCVVSSFRAETAMLARKKLAWWHISNPFWRYAGLELGYLALSAWIGGWLGVALFAVQAAIAVWQLELVNYIEHYGLVRKHLGGGKYEPVRPHHSWNAAQKVSNWMLINLQRHSDHHYKPDRRFPLLQNYSGADAPQLPAGYPVLTAVALFPPLWRRVMNKRVRSWRKMYYPEVVDWREYAKHRTPMPASAG